MFPHLPLPNRKKMSDAVAKHEKKWPSRPEIFEPTNKKHFTPFSTLFCIIKQNCQHVQKSSLTNADQRIKNVG